MTAMRLGLKESIVQMQPDMLLSFTAGIHAGKSHESKSSPELL